MFGEKYIGYYEDVPDFVYWKHVVKMIQMFADFLNEFQVLLFFMFQLFQDRLILNKRLYR